MVMAPLSTVLLLCGGSSRSADYLFGLVTPDSFVTELRLMETRSNNHLERDTLPPATVPLRLSIAAPLATWNQMNPEFGLVDTAEERCSGSPIADIEFKVLPFLESCFALLLLLS